MAEHFYFTWVNEGEAFDPDVHNRNDESVYSFEYEQQEGDFAGLKVTLKNPRIGLLNVGRKVWCYLAFNTGTQTAPVATPFFHGRLVGIPTNIFETLVTIEFVARPSNFVAQKAAVAAALKVLPYWDPIFVKPESWPDPDAVLEAYSRLWHIHPVTLVVSTSDVLVPENGTVEVFEADHFYDEMSTTLNQTPLRSVHMTAIIPWQQQGVGSVDLNDVLIQMNGSRIVESFTFKGLLDDWPKVGDSFGSGWVVSAGSSLVDTTYAYKRKEIPQLFYWQGEVPNQPQGSIIFPLKVTGEYHSGEQAGFNFQYEIVAAGIGFGWASLGVEFARDVAMAQVVTFTLYSDQQAIITLPGDDEALIVNLNANSVSDYTENNVIPMGNVRSRDYVHSDRGMQSVEHLLLVARAHLISRSRAVETEFMQKFRKAFLMRDLKKAALLHDHRLPGGQAIGKIIGVKLALDGDTGAPLGHITIGSCVGKGGSHSANAGTPSYVELGVLEPGIQEQLNVVLLTDTADIAYTIPSWVEFDDGLDFIRGLTSRDVVLGTPVITNTSTEQAVLINAAGDGPNTDQAKIQQVLKDHPTTFQVQLVPMEGGPFQQEVVISVADLVIPKQIDLEAPSNA